MAKNNNIRDLLKSVADAIRSKKGITDLINPQNFHNEILSIGGNTDDFIDSTGLGKNGIKKIIISNGVESIDNRAYFEWSVESIILPDSILKVGSSAFYGTKLHELIIPPKVSIYEYELTQNCSLLSKVFIPEGIIQIRGYAFKNCISLPRVDLPSSILYIENQAFFGCTSLKTIVINATTPPSLSNSQAFSSNAEERLFYVPDASVDAYKSATNWSTYADVIKPLSELPNE